MPLAKIEEYSLVPLDLEVTLVFFFTAEEVSLVLLAPHYKTHLTRGYSVDQQFPSVLIASVRLNCKACHFSYYSISRFGEEQENTPLL